MGRSVAHLTAARPLCPNPSGIKYEITVTQEQTWMWPKHGAPRHKGALHRVSDASKRCRTDKMGDPTTAADRLSRTHGSTRFRCYGSGLWRTAVCQQHDCAVLPHFPCPLLDHHNRGSGAVFSASANAPSSRQATVCRRGHGASTTKTRYGRKAANPSVTGFARYPLRADYARWPASQKAPGRPPRWTASNEISCCVTHRKTIPS
ncbi:hypothetical protein BH11ACT7_BH11ACT7_33770 [soil metagenome]